jgi:hypothetical protein
MFDFFFVAKRGRIRKAAYNPISSFFGYLYFKLKTVAVIFKSKFYKK